MILDVLEALFYLKFFLHPCVRHCEQYWSAQKHIHLKIRNRLKPATTKKLVYACSNSKMMAATGYANELKMLAYSVHLMKIHSCNVAASDQHAPLLASHSQCEALVAKLPSL